MNKLSSSKSRKFLEEQQNSIRVTILLRFLIVSISSFIFILPVYLAGFSLFQSNFWLVYAIFIMIFALNFIYRLILPKIRNFESFIVLQIVIDIFLVSGLIYLTGANYSNFVFLYFSAILASSMLTATRKGFVLTTLCTLLLIVVTLIYMNNYFLLDSPPPVLHY